MKTLVCLSFIIKVCVCLANQLGCGNLQVLLADLFGCSGYRFWNLCSSLQGFFGSPKELPWHITYCRVNCMCLAVLTVVICLALQACTSKFGSGVLDGLKISFIVLLTLKFFTVKLPLAAYLLLWAVHQCSVQSGPAPGGGWSRTMICIISMQ